jgi:uncharacterized protein with FMN-binding domain
MTRKWQGTALFALVMAGVSATVAGRLLAGGGAVADASGAPSGASSSAPAGPASSGDSAAAGDSGSSDGSTSSSASSTVQGDVEQTRFGAVQVALTFSGSKIVSVQTLQAPSQSGRDQMLTQYATPQLAQEVVASQSAKVDTISGATYTSEGYLASVQSAIDKHP